MIWISKKNCVYLSRITHVYGVKTTVGGHFMTTEQIEKHRNRQSKFL